jgi:hypothetical protein
MSDIPYQPKVAFTDVRCVACDTPFAVGQQQIHEPESDGMICAVCMMDHQIDQSNNAEIAMGDATP